MENSSEVQKKLKQIKYNIENQFSHEEIVEISHENNLYDILIDLNNKNLACKDFQIFSKIREIDQLFKEQDQFDIKLTVELSNNQFNNDIFKRLKDIHFYRLNLSYNPIKSLEGLSKNAIYIGNRIDLRNCSLDDKNFNYSRSPLLIYHSKSNKFCTYESKLMLLFETNQLSQIPLIKDKKQRFYVKLNDNPIKFIDNLKNTPSIHNYYLQYNKNLDHYFELKRNHKLSSENGKFIEEKVFNEEQEIIGNDSPGISDIEFTIRPQSIENCSFLNIHDIFTIPKEEFINCFNDLEKIKYILRMQDEINQLIKNPYIKFDRIEEIENIIDITIYFDDFEIYSEEIQSLFESLEKFIKYAKRTDLKIKSFEIQNCPGNNDLLKKLKKLINSKKIPSLENLNFRHCDFGIQSLDSLFDKFCDEEISCKFLGFESCNVRNLSIINQPIELSSQKIGHICLKDNQLEKIVLFSKKNYDSGLQVDLSKNKINLKLSSTSFCEVEIKNYKEMSNISYILQENMIISDIQKYNDLRGISCVNEDIFSLQELKSIFYQYSIKKIQESNLREFLIENQCSFYDITILKFKNKFFIESLSLDFAILQFDDEKINEKEYQNASESFLKILESSNSFPHLKNFEIKNLKIPNLLRKIQINLSLPELSIFSIENTNTDYEITIEINRDLQKIKSINFSNNKIQDFSLIKKIKNIQKLNISNNKLNNNHLFRILKYCKSLKKLNISNNKIIDLIPLKELSNHNLKTLDISFNQINQNFHFLGNLKVLEQLVIDKIIYTKNKKQLVYLPENIFELILDEDIKNKEEIKKLKGDITKEYYPNHIMIFSGLNLDKVPLVNVLLENSLTYLSKINPLNELYLINNQHLHPNKIMHYNSIGRLEEIILEDDDNDNYDFQKYKKKIFGLFTNLIEIATCYTKFVNEKIKIVINLDSFIQNRNITKGTETVDTIKNKNLMLLFIITFANNLDNFEISYESNEGNFNYLPLLNSRKIIDCGVYPLFFLKLDFLKEFNNHNFYESEKILKEMEEKFLDKNNYFRKTEFDLLKELNSFYLDISRLNFVRINPAKNSYIRTIIKEYNKIKKSQKKKVFQIFRIKNSDLNLITEQLNIINKFKIGKIVNCQRRDQYHMFFQKLIFSFLFLNNTNYHWKKHNFGSAVARLYRLIEMIFELIHFQFELKNHSQLSVDDLVSCKNVFFGNLKNFFNAPQNESCDYQKYLREKYSSIVKLKGTTEICKTGKANNYIKLDLTTRMCLCIGMYPELFEEINLKKIWKILNLRNNSIWGHGYSYPKEKSINMVEFNEFFELILNHISNYDIVVDNFEIFKEIKQHFSSTNFYIHLE